MQFVLLTVILLVPLVFLPGVFFHFNTTPKIAILLLAIPIQLMFCEGNVKHLRGLWSAREGRAWVILLAAQCFAGGLSVMASTHRALSVNGSLWRRSGFITETALAMFVLLVAAWLSANKERTQVLLRTLAVTGSLAAVYGIFQYFGHDPFLAPTTYEAGEGIFTIIRPPGTIGHADYFASFLLMIFFPAAALAVTETRKTWRRFWLCGCALIALAIVLSGTRAAWLGLIAGVVSLAVLKQLRIPVQAWITGVALAGGLVAFAISPAGAHLRARLHWSLDDVGGGARILLWRDSLYMAAHRPWLGFGQETFATEFPRFASIQLARAYPDFYQESPHNAFLDAFASGGVVGLACLLGLVVLAIGTAWRARREGNPLAELLLAGFIAVLVDLQFTVTVMATALIFYLYIGILVTLRFKALANESPRRVPVAYWIAAAGSLLFPVFATQLILADSLLLTVQRRIDAGDANGAAAAYAGALRSMPSGASFDLSYSRAMAILAGRSPVFMVRVKAWGEAKEFGARAVTTAEDRQNAWYSLASLYAAENNASAAETSLRNAIEWAPNWFKPHWTLAGLLELTGRHREALQEAAAAMDSDAGRDPEVIGTWKTLSARTP
jgi:O-antigen ligase